MTTGKVEYAPDYKSKKKGVMLSRQSGGAYVDANEVIEDELARIRKEHVDYSVTVEHQRLQSAVVEAVRVWWNNGSIDALHESMNNLIAFEAAHGIGERDETS